MVDESFGEIEKSDDREVNRQEQLCKTPERVRR
jgi:hypothetical protein